MMFRFCALLPHMTGVANVGYGLRDERMGRAERAARVAGMRGLVRVAPPATDARTSTSTMMANNLLLRERVGFIS